LIGNPRQAPGGLSFDSDADGIPDTIELQMSEGKPGPNPGDLGDGINPLDSTDWSDATGDADGDGVPNAWEYHLDPKLPNMLPGDPPITNPKLDITGNGEPDPWQPHLHGVAFMYDPEVSPPAHITVNRNLPQVTSGWPRNYHTISSAIAALPNESSTNPSSYRIIRVSPGLYEENLSISTSLNVAILPNRPTLNFTVEGQTYPLFDPRGEIEIRGTHATNPVISITNSHVVLDGMIVSRRVGTAGPVISITQGTTPTERIYLTRLSNCLFRNNNTANSSVIDLHRSRLILSHCTFFMNASSNGSLGAAVSTLNLTNSSSFHNSVAQVRIHNSILWNPVNTNVPEYQVAGPLHFISSIVHQRRGADGTFPDSTPGILPAGTDPHLTPLGYLIGPAGGMDKTGAMGRATPNLHSLRDMHGEWRSNTHNEIDIGAHQWADDDMDGIPNFADTINPWDLEQDLTIEDQSERTADWIARSAANVDFDHDNDGISELQEYLWGTDVNNADTNFLSIHQAMRMFAPLGAGGTGSGSAGVTMNQILTSFYTKEQSDALYWRKTDTIRIPEAGDLSMGDYTAGPPLP
jgi:hypothetical protein